MKCSICHSGNFVTFNNRHNARCENCGSLERHRAVYQILLDRNIVEGAESILHLAPEACLVNSLQKYKFKEYILADMNVEHYKEAFGLECIHFDASRKYVFNDNKFDLIIHNHVLEHLAGDYNDHIIEMIRVLKPKGKIIFTVPFFKKIKNTIQNGEYLTKEQRNLMFGQDDHYKLFGKDFLYYLTSLNGVDTEIIELENFSSMDTVFIIEKENK